MLNDDAKIAIYEWQAKDYFLLPVLSSPYVRIEAFLDDWGADVINRLPPSTELFAFHLNLTQTAAFPHNRAQLCRLLAERGIRVLNANATNISKAFVQAACTKLGLPSTKADASGDPEASVIVKSNLNYGGIGEKILEAGDIRFLGWSLPTCPLDAGAYKVLKRREVMQCEWDDPALFIERFIQNSEERFCRAYVMGRHLVVSEVIDASLLKKMPPGIERTNGFFVIGDFATEPVGACSMLANQVAQSVGIFMRGLAMDFAALDVVIDDDGVGYIIDVNTTPSWKESSDVALEMFLKAGLEALIRSS